MINNHCLRMDESNHEYDFDQSQADLVKLVTHLDYLW